MWYTSPTQFPIAFTEVYVGVGTILESATERSSSNFDNAVRLSLDKIEFAKFEHYYIALGKSCPIPSNGDNLKKIKQLYPI